MFPPDSPIAVPPDRLARFIPGLPPAITVDASAVRQWLTRPATVGGYGIAAAWKPTAEDVAELVDAIDRDDTALVRAAWRRSAAVLQVFTLRLHTTVYVFGADTVYGGRVCTVPLLDDDLVDQAPGTGVDAAVAALVHIAGLIDQAWRRTVSSLWALP